MMRKTEPGSAFHEFSALRYALGYLKEETLDEEKELMREWSLQFLLIFYEFYIETAK